MAGAGGGAGRGARIRGGRRLAALGRAGRSRRWARLAGLAGARPRDRWYFALVGAAVLLAWNPYSLLDPGFQLSFGAVAAIFVLVPRLERRLEGYPLPRRLATVLALSGGCGIATAPILWAHFGALPVWSILANVLAAPVVAPILGLGLSAAAVGSVLPGAAAALAWINGWLVAYLAWCARAIGGLPFAQSSLPQVVLGVVAAFAVLLAAAACHLPRPALAPPCSSFVAAAVVAACLHSGRAVLLRPLRPTGSESRFSTSDRATPRFSRYPRAQCSWTKGRRRRRSSVNLTRLGVERLALLVLTHPERDHVGGAEAVLRRLEVEAVLDPRQPVESPYEEAALQAAAERGARVVTARRGQVFRLGRLVLRVLWPDGSARPGDNPNDNAVVLLATYGAVDTLLTADAESGVTGRLALRPVEILKVAHHGSSDPGLAGLLVRLRPSVAVISVGARNDYGHPTPATLNALEDRDGLDVYRTDEDGAVVIESDGHPADRGDGGLTYAHARWPPRPSSPST